MFSYVRFPLFSAGHNHEHTVHHAPLERREERTGVHNLIALTNHACKSRHRQQVTLHRKKPLKTLRFEHGGRVTDGRGQLDFPDHASVHLEVSLLGPRPEKNPGFDSAAHELRTCTFHEDAQRQLKSCNHGQQEHDGDAQCGGGGWVPKSLTCRCRGFSPPFHSFSSWPRRCTPRGGRQRGRCRRDTGGNCPRCSTSRGWYAAARPPRTIGCQGRRNPCPEAAAGGPSSEPAAKRRRHVPSRRRHVPLRHQQVALPRNGPLQSVLKGTQKSLPCSLPKAQAPRRRRTRGLAYLPRLLVCRWAPKGIG